jgi:hypothetical protein
MPVVRFGPSPLRAWYRVSETGVDGDGAAALSVGSKRHSRLSRSTVSLSKMTSATQETMATANLRLAEKKMILGIRITIQTKEAAV